MAQKQDERARLASWHWRQNLARLLLGAALLISGSWAPRTGCQLEHHRTAMGEERSVTLADGSWTHLYGGTTLDSCTSGGLTDVFLRKGSALFDVRHDPNRVFQVNVNRIVVRDFGTQFEVVKERGAASISVFEGSVGLAIADTAGVRSTVTAGKKARIREDGQIIPERQPAGANLPELSHTPQFLRAKTIVEIADAFNRNNLSQRFIVEGAARERRASVAFDMSRPEKLLSALTTDPQLSTELRGRFVIIRAAR